MTEKRKRAAADELDEVLDAVVRAIPPERHGEMRAVLREALVRTSRKAAAPRPPAPTPDEAALETHTEPSSRPSAPAPISSTRQRAARIADNIILSATRASEASMDSRDSQPEMSRVRLKCASPKPTSGGQLTTYDSRPTTRVLPHTVRLSDVAPESLRWLWRDRIPAGKITVLDGDPGLGKSTLL